jgi:hypothetical protein
LPHPGRDIPKEHLLLLGVCNHPLHVRVIQLARPDLYCTRVLPPQVGLELQ